VVPGHLVEQSKDFNLAQKTGHLVLHGLDLVGLGWLPDAVARAVYAHLHAVPGRPRPERAVPVPRSGPSKDGEQ
jgi:hypothetical protein